MGNSIKLKSAQVDFIDVNVRRLLGYIGEEQYQCQEKLRLIEQIFKEFNNIKAQGQLQISLQDVRSDAGLWEMIQSVLGSDHWTLNPHAPVLGKRKFSMNKENQSLVDFLQTLPFASFMAPRSPLSNKEAQTLYDIWTYDKKDEYGKNIIPDGVDAMLVTSLTSKGYMRNHSSRFATRDLRTNKTCDFTDKGKEVIRKIILFNEQSAFEKTSNTVDYEAICRANVFGPKTNKVASKQRQPRNWLERSWK